MQSLLQKSWIRSQQQQNWVILAFCRHGIGADDDYLCLLREEVLATVLLLDHEHAPPARVS